MDESCDVAVIGGGPVGSALALELSRAGLAVTLIEARVAGGANDTRPLALSWGSRLILDRLGVWDALVEPTPIARIHISQRGAFGRTELTAAEAGLPALGYVVDYAGLVAALDACVAGSAARVRRGARVDAVHESGAHAQVHWSSPSTRAQCRASLVVVADGSALAAATRVRVQDYAQSAVTARVRSTLPHAHTAYERFTPDGPLALLPAGEEYALVWSVRPGDALPLRDAPPAAFLERLEQCFGGRVGRFTHVAARMAHRLALRVAVSTELPRAILIGNAAQSLHPVAGQGFNLGLRDAWELAREVARSGAQDVALHQRFSSSRRLDRAGGIAFTDALVRLFSNDSPPLALARGLGLTLLDCVPPAKDFLARRMIFGARG